LDYSFHIAINFVLSSLNLATFSSALEAATLS
jgi:hypothetical protein